MVSVLRAPKTFTREDMLAMPIELTMIMVHVWQNQVEYTKRAF